MEAANSFLIYLILFRLSTVIAGIVSIVLGYKLFMAGIVPEKGADVEGEMNEIRISFRNVAPGTCFALFGAAVIAFNFYQGGPEFTMKMIESAADIRHADLGNRKISEITMKSTDEVTLFKLIESAKNHEVDNERGKAIQQYQRALALIGEPMNNLATLYLDSGKMDEAGVLAESATRVYPDHPAFLHTYATALYKLGQKDKAVTVMRKAVKLHPRYNRDLQNMVRD